MWKQKIGISIGNSYKIPTVDVIKTVAKIGFEAISPEWKKDVDIAEIVKVADEAGLIIQSLHAPFGKSAAMWNEDEAVSKPALDELLMSLEACKKYNIPVMVVHTWIGFEYTDKPNNTGFENFKKLVDKAAEYGVKIAFENTEGEEFLFALMDFFEENDTVGFCWDSGHEMCYNHSKNLLADYGERLIMTHLNDNLGISRFDGITFWTDDLHLLPGDGIADWDELVERMRQSKRLEILNFELNMKSKPGRHDNDIYENMTIEQYFTEAYKRACRIAYKYSK